MEGEEEIDGHPLSRKTAYLWSFFCFRVTFPRTVQEAGVRPGCFSQGS